ncbi:MAG TPA: DUF2059 domain-containing protein [Candidatus Acidoferrum sp.]|jgi:hypothetical protein|nr:DUF2059 domain-containing protein [Candidatus Acidoferrum sp.]
MKISLVLAVCLTLGSIVGNAQSTSGSAGKTPNMQGSSVSKSNATAATKIDPAKEADIRRLLDLAGTKALVVQTMDSMSKSIKPLLTNSLPPGEYREKLVDLFFAKFSAKADVEHLLDLAVPVYDKNFSHQEIRSLIEFYQTPLGQKAIATLPKVTAEMQEQGRKWGEDLGRQCMVEVLSEHPELADALNNAQSNAQAASK